VIEDKTIFNSFFQLGSYKISRIAGVLQIRSIPQPPARQIINLLATDKSQYLAQPRPIIVISTCRHALHAHEVSMTHQNHQPVMK